MTVDSSQTAPPQAPKKGMSPLAWVGIGCGVILVIVLIGIGACTFIAKRKLAELSKNPEMTVAKMVVAANPDLELVKADDDAKTLTIRDKKTGKETTLDLEDVKNGNFKFTDEKGETASLGVQGGENGGSLTVTNEKGEKATFGGSTGAPKDLPDWVPVYPHGSAQASFSANTNEGKSSTFVVSTKDPVEQVVGFFESKLKEAGLKVTKSTFGANGELSGGTVSGESDDNKRSVQVIVSSSDEGTQATVAYTEKN